MFHAQITLSMLQKKTLEKQLKVQKLYENLSPCYYEKLVFL